MEDKKLWKKAKARVWFRRHLLIYVLVNLMLWAIWIVTNWYDTKGNGSFPWPIFPMLGWGIGVVFDYYENYCRSTEDKIKEEYEKLKGPDK